MASGLERVKSATADLLKLDASAIKETSRFVEDLGASSIQSIELVAALEEEFDIEMDEDEALGIKTIADAAEFIEKVMKD